MTRPRLSRALLADPAWRASTALALPTSAMLSLPERAVQFGTGAFLRGFVDAFIDAANTRGQFNGRVVAIGQTGSGRDRAFVDQDGLYTLVSRGIVHGAARDDRRVVGSVSRALSAAAVWDAVLECAHAPELSIVFSNTTEVGIVFDERDGFDDAPPASFPGKLTRFLYERAHATDFAQSSGVIVVPCELIAGNGTALRALVARFAALWALDPRFMSWIDASVPFCNTLVDRIVPGAPSDLEGDALAAELGYDDALMTMAEPFRQLVIEGDAALKARLGFVDADAGIIITPDITPYRERKVRLLNGAHSISVAVALLSGCTTVCDAMTHPLVGSFIRRTLLGDIVPTLDVPDAEPFARSVLERFANPFIRHALFDITLQGTTKLRVRIVPTISRAADMRGRVPAALAFGLAAHLLFLRGDLHQRRLASGQSVPPDEPGARIHDAWVLAPPVPDAEFLRAMVNTILSDVTLWGTDLSRLHAFVDDVTLHLARILTLGMEPALSTLLTGRAT